MITNIDTNIDPFNQIMLTIPVNEVFQEMRTVPKFSFNKQNQQSNVVHNPNPPNLTSIGHGVLRFSRSHNVPSYLKDFHSNLVTHTKPSYPLEHVTIYDNISEKQKKLFMNSITIVELKRYNEATKHKE